MVANIHYGKRLRSTLRYNEEKMDRGQAECLLAINFVKDLDKLSLRDKHWHFERLTSLKDRATSNILHISLNFEPGEQLSNSILCEIARVYMDMIGFGLQPALVYRHYDAFHPHIHIVSTNVRTDGKLIYHRNLAGLESCRAVKEIESRFGLVKYENRLKDGRLNSCPGNAEKIFYGKSATFQSVSQILSFVLGHYAYGSLEELNAVLRLYQVAADPGLTDSRLYKYRGLYYRVLDGSGRKIGAPLRASDFPFRPTLDFLERRCTLNTPLLRQRQRRMDAVVGWQLQKKQIQLSELFQELSRERISTLVRQTGEGIIHGFTFVDHADWAVFHGENLAGRYTASAICESCSFPGRYHRESLAIPGENYILPSVSPAQTGSESLNVRQGEMAGEKLRYNIPEILISPPQNPGRPIYPFEEQDKRRRREYLTLRL